LSILSAPLQGNILSSVYNASVNEEVQVSVYSADGKVVANTSRTVSDGKNILRIDLPNLTQGIYFLSVYSNDSRVTQKFTKL